MEKRGAGRNTAATTQHLKLINFLLWGGVALLLLGLVLSYPRAAPYLRLLLHPPAAPTPLAGAGAPENAATMPPTSLAAETPEAEATMLTPVEEPEPAAAGEGGDPTLPPEVEPAPGPAIPLPGLAPNPEVSRGITPTRLLIPAINLTAPIEPIDWKVITSRGASYAIWNVPNWRAAGWHETSVGLGVPGNTVLNGHNTANGEVFRHLYRLEPGDGVQVEGADGVTYTYEVAETYILPEAGQPIATRMRNARHIQATEDERVTLVTCHPYGSFANRLLVIAYPAPSRGEPTRGE